ncbi:uncharacterized protein IL334_003590 [Kwoniella shivajii]|uniref:Uncharacterized protein n=1 Tax=Kwoniella shivajii TaxID=564305 RepID=A0ABZ1CYC6_9TREE|nr:hypothetical protein IL334_003590 [Kwoniella shivajii]
MIDSTSDTTGSSRNTSTYTHSSFLSAIYLDPGLIPESPIVSHTARLSNESKSIHIEAELGHLVEEGSGSSDGYEDVEDQHRYNYPANGAYEGGTKPLRVRKKRGVITVQSKLAAKNKPRRRKSTFSFPQSPSTPCSARFSFPKRNPSSTSTSSKTSSHPHSKISRLFLSLPTTSPSPTSGIFDKGKMIVGNDRFSGSSLHLGLGKFNSYDLVVPGPSPPTSPFPSPTKRSFATIANMSSNLNADMKLRSHSDVYSKKALPLPPSPLTPSRAPRKAAALLGAGYPNSSSTKQPKKGKLNGLNGKHFRPLPNSALIEIERFFGEIPKKPSKVTRPIESKGSPTTDRNRAKSLSSASNERGLGDRKVGEGGAVGYKNEDGSMWLDVEEEQEFAWLLSEIFSLVPQPLPLPLSPSNNVKIHSDNCETGKETVLIHQHHTLEQDHNDEENDSQWEMENFTSILCIPEPKSKAKSNLKSRYGQSKGRQEHREASDDSFLNMETPKLSRSFNVSTANPWSISTAAPKHSRSLSNPDVSPKLSISPPMPALIPPPRLSSRRDQSLTGNRSVSNSASSSGSSSETEKDLVRKVKNRPPPLTLPKIKPSSKLPILTATSPISVSKAEQHYKVVQYHIKPTSVHKQAQAQQHQHQQSQPGQQGHQAPSTPFVKPRTAPKPGNADVPIPARPQMRHEEQPMSFFDPVTPTEPTSKMRNQATIGKEKKGWLKRMVRRPLDGGRI